MNKFKYYFILSITTLSLFSCSKNNDTAEITPPREYAVQYATDITDIEEYLNTYYITVTNNPGSSDDQDVVFTKIPDGGTQASIMSYKDKTTFPKLLSRDVSLHDITYKLYYLVLREGVKESPCNVDGVLAAYKGDYLQQTLVSGVTSLTATAFQEVKYPQTFFSLYTIENVPLRAWSEIFPQFKTGTAESNGNDGTVSYKDFGAGVMFIPSGLSYYSSGSDNIPAYAPLVFSFKLYALQRLDQDGDGIPSYQEDLNGDGYMYYYGNTVNYPTSPADKIRYADDSDGDGIPNFLDVDDDADGYGTRSEITKADGTLMAFDAIPSCNGDTSDPARIKKHLDKSCH
ncbi:FKBP-type peptidylprolyl isomerase [Flavobacterium frigoris]|uniref:Uncharacterized protein n=1 Tax=Flavobacterium frigoris TaxID=229204 RepID=A0A1H9M0M3_FLAFI|nr:FKBP-type peptidylprolyl isomerase [Flavobacterium frigoris]SER16995.1 hypothetical protein SAMN05444355_107199 [Flavobacterium frigoris]